MKVTINIVPNCVATPAQHNIALMRLYIFAFFFLVSVDILRMFSCKCLQQFRQFCCLLSSSSCPSTTPATPATYQVLPKRTSQFLAADKITNIEHLSVSSRGTRAMISHRDSVVMFQLSSDDIRDGYELMALCFEGIKSHG